jgi:uncharacterized protein (DUF4415 family)
MKGKPMKKTVSKSLTAAQRTELAALKALPDHKINTKGIPEQRDWSVAKRGLFYRPIKKQLTLRLDADLIEWFKTRKPGGEGYQTEINKALRKFVTQNER